jgi:flagellar basal-body rod protein FlgC
MSLNGILSGMDVSATGMRAERLRMEVVASNVANAQSTRSADGGPYRRQQIVFVAVAPESHGSPGPSAGALGGVQVAGIVDDPAPLREVFDPNHPDANENGLVALPNVSLPLEMVDLMTASRAYEINLKAMETFRQMAEQTLALLRGANS